MTDYHTAADQNSPPEPRAGWDRGYLTTDSFVACIVACMVLAVVVGLLLKHVV